MTRWHCYKLTVTLRSDLHCGDRPLGFVARTLPYVPQHLPFYALVPVLVEKLGMPDRQESYNVMEQFVGEFFRFLPLYVLDGNEGKPLFPWNPAAGKKMESDYLGARYGVAIDYQARAARENCLFETETILARNRTTGTVTRLAGYLCAASGSMATDEGQVSVTAERKKCCVDRTPLCSFLEDCQWGGERNKGLGRIEVADLAPVDTVYGMTMELGGPAPVLIWREKEQAPFLLREDEGLRKIITGLLAPKSGRRYAANKGPGLRSPAPFIAWEPGWSASATMELCMGIRCTTARTQSSGT